MGANSCKHSGSDIKPNSLTSDENDSILKLFKSIKGSKLEHLTRLWDGRLDEHLQQLVIGYVADRKSDTVDLNKFVNLFACLVRGSVYEKSDVLFEMLSDSKQTDVIERSVVIKYVESLISSYIASHKTLDWDRGTKSDVERLAASLCLDVSTQATGDGIVSWLSAAPKISALQASVYGGLYGIKSSTQRLLPTRDKKAVKSVLSACDVMFVNASLPAALRDEWRLLFSTHKHGESFSKLLGHMQNKGPTVLVLRDKGGHVFGGFAPHPWALGPNYVGDETSFLFGLLPVMRVHGATGFNDHYQYLNVQQKTMPNGLGMGGQHDYWGVWIDAEFGVGHSSETCTTYRDCKTLSQTKEFHVDHLEVWAVGPLPVNEQEVGTRSILDTNTEAKAMLEMMGKTAHSDGLREPEEIDY